MIVKKSQEHKIEGQAEEIDYNSILNDLPLVIKEQERLQVLTRPS